MANKKENQQPVNNKVVITVPNPDSLPLTTKIPIGGTATWKCSTSKYPKFQINFAESNPFNDRKNAKFKGSNSQPVALEVKKRGNFTYNIKHIKPGGGRGTLTGPFKLTAGIRKPPPPPGKLTAGIKKPPPPPAPQG